jgi:hypothetical protein
MQNTPPVLDTAALCVDGRASWDFGGRGLVAQDVIEGLGHHLFEQDGPLVLAHPQQDLAAPFRRANTKKPTGKRFFYNGWEREFVAARQISWFHRFLPLDRINATGKCAQITTLLAPMKKNPFFLSRKNGHHFVVPSQADALWLEKHYGVPTSQLTVIKPSPRRAVLKPASFHVAGERGIIVVRDGRKDGFERHVSVMRRCFPHTRIVTVDLRDREATSADRWLRTLQNAMACFYLVDRPFDWATLALEALYWDVPTFYADKNRTLGEVLPLRSIQLHSFLADPPTPGQLITLGAEAREKLESTGVLDPDQQAVAYKELYLRLGAIGLY